MQMKQNEIEWGVEVLVADVMRKVDSLNDATGNLVSFLEMNGIGMTDEKFDLINEIKDGEDDIKEAVRILMQKED